MRKKKSSTLITLSAAIVLLLTVSQLLLLSNLLVQSVQAQTTPMTFKTRIPATGEIGEFSTCEAALTFDAQGTNSTSGGQNMNGTFQITSIDGGEVWSSGKIREGTYRNGNNNNEGGSIELVADVYKSNSSMGCAPQQSNAFIINTDCSTSAENRITFSNLNADLRGPVECSSPQGGTGAGADTAHTMTGSSAQESSSSDSGDGDGDRDGIPDSSDKCPHNSHHRCFKEGDTSTTSTSTNQQQPPSSNSTGNQTR